MDPQLMSDREKRRLIRRIHKAFRIMQVPQVSPDVYDLGGMHFSVRMPQQRAPEQPTEPESAPDAPTQPTEPDC